MENVIVRTGGSGEIGKSETTEVTDESEDAAELQGPRLGVIVRCPLCNVKKTTCFRLGEDFRGQISFRRRSVLDVHN